MNFSRDVLPILSDNCFNCHGPDEGNRQAELRLDTEQGAMAARDSGKTLVPGKSGESLLFQRITSDDDSVRMPPPDSNRQLSKQQIETLRQWIDGGAAWGKHWAFEPPTRPELPAIKNAAWPRNEIDRFILARLEQEGLQPSPEAAKETLLRRVTLDLTGLPPTLEEIDAFLLDNRPDAYEKLVDRLLASPRYGERMAWEWLDAARYADTNGYQGDSTRTMWPWRDWAVAALNANMPFDQFTIWQLAGDLLPEATLEQKLATGFHRNHMINGEGGRIAEESRVDYVVDRVDTTATVWLGLTLGCARCHDHKFDPLSQRDYYQMYAYFNNINETGGERSGQAAPAMAVPSEKQSEKRSQLAAAVKQRSQQVADLEKELAAAQPEWESKRLAELEEAAGGENSSQIPENVAAALKTAAGERTEAQTKELKEYYLGQSKELAEAKKQLDAARKSQDAHEKSIPRVMVLEERAERRPTHILIRGAYDKYGEPVTVGTPQSLHPLPDEAPANRLALARWLVDPANPLTARVTVNRAWQTFFGMGIVKTAEDFGVQGEKPSHRQLLDWLATEFVSNDPASGRQAWDLKRLHRLIVTSATYRQSSRVEPALVQRDPDNRLLARGPRFRLPSFMLRDQALAASGLLVEKVGGPPVMPYQPEGVWEEATFGKIKYQQGRGDDLYRRTLYTFWRRIVGPTTLFDTASRQVCTVRQPITNSPLHALTLLNDTTFVEAARAMGQRVLQIEGAGDAARIETAFRLATARRPTVAEQKILSERLEELRRQYKADGEAARKLLAVGDSKRDEKLDASEHAAYTGLCLLILNLDEVLTKE